MAGLKAFHRIQLGAESTAGTAVATTEYWRGVGAMPEDARTIEFVEELNNIAVPTDRSYTSQIMSTMTLQSTPATYEQLPIILSACMKDVTPVADSGGASGYIMAYDIGTSTPNTIKTYTIQAGDNQQAEQMDYAFVTDFSLSGTAGEAVMVSSNWVGRALATDTFDSATLISDIEEILAGNGQVWINDSGSIGTTAVSDTVLGFDLQVTSGQQPKFFIDGNRLDYNYVYYNIDNFDVTLSLVYEHNSTGVAEKAAFRNETTRAIRLRFDGSAVGTTGGVYDNKTLIIDFVGRYTAFGALTDQEGNSIYNVTMTGKYNVANTEGPLDITVVNERSSVIT